MKFFATIFVFIGLNTFSGHGQLIVDTTLTPEFLVNNILLGPGVVASNIQFTGQQKASGMIIRPKVL